jgi:hypothetical protein
MGLTNKRLVALTNSNSSVKDRNGCVDVGDVIENDLYV